MAAAPNSSLLLDNVNKILTTFIPIHNYPDSNQLYASIGVKSHGTITFPDNKSNRAEFIRVPPEASVMHVKELLNGQWCHGRPSLVISVTGGAKEYNMKPKLLRAFRRGLLKVARTTGAWIITGGMNTGIMKLVGEIVQINPDRSRPIHLIGIATWGCVSGFDQLNVNGSNVHYAKPRSEQRGEAPLEPNHTEFIFVDDGSERKYGGEITFRAKLEQAISGGFFATKTATHTTQQSASLAGNASLRPEQSDPIPVVLLVVEGGPNTVRTVHEAVVQNSIPAVFLEGTGRCCDLFAKACHLYDEYLQQPEFNDETTLNNDPSKRNEIKSKLRAALNDELNAISGANEPPSGGANKPPRKSAAAGADKNARVVDTTDYFELVYECLQTRKNFLNVISLNSRSPVEPDIDLVILQALLNATSSNDQSKTNIQRKREQLHLALEWNRVDIAKNYIMRNDRDWAKIDLNDLFTLALDRDQVAFVKLFLDHDFSLTDLFRNHDNFLTLYRNEIDSYTNISNDVLRTIYKDIIQPLIGDFFDADAIFPSAKSTANRECIVENGDGSCFCCGPSNNRATTANNRRGSTQSQGSATYATGAHIDVDKELFLWSVIKGRREFALLFWSRGKNKICAALIATLLYRKRARKDNDNSYNESADEFENLAVQILDKFYQTSYHTCTKALIRQIPAYGNVTWLQLAVAAEAKQFISQRAVQDVLNNIWYGYIDQRIPDMTIVFSTIMLWYSGFLPYQNELVKTNDDAPALDNTIHKSNLFQTQTSQQKRIIDRPTDTVNVRLISGITDEDPSPVNFVDFGCWEKTKTGVSRYFVNIATFMCAPYVKYLYNLYFHVIFLSLFSYVILCDFFPLYDSQVDVNKCPPSSKAIAREEHIPDIDRNGRNGTDSIPYGLRLRTYPAMTELVLVVWVFTLLCEEIRQLFSTEAQSKRNAISAYFKIFWNRLDVLALILFFVGFTLRFYPSPDCFCAARIILSVDLTIWFMRSMDIFAAVKRLGPKLVMIGEMAHDLKFFMLMLIVFILAFGVPSYTLIYGVQKFSWHLPREIVNLAYWQIFGELNALDTFNNNYKANGYAVFILLVAYMSVVSILLVNLLIAMFSNTFDRLQTNTDRIWKFQRYSLVCEYLSRPSLPPPFIFFSHLWRFALYTSARCFCSNSIRRKYVQHSNRTKYQISLNEKYTTIIEIAEDALGDEVYYSHLKIGRKLVDETDLDEERVQTPQENILTKVRVLENRIQIMSNQQAHMFEYLECLMDGLRIVGGNQIRVPEGRRFDPEESLINTQVDDEPLLHNYHLPAYHSI